MFCVSNDSTTTEQVTDRTDYQQFEDVSMFWVSRDSPTTKSVKLTGHSINNSRTYKRNHCLKNKQTNKRFLSEHEIFMSPQLTANKQIRKAYSTSTYAVLESDRLKITTVSAER